jgi:hypothetical protein
MASNPTQHTAPIVDPAGGLDTGGLGHASINQQIVEEASGHQQGANQSASLHATDEDDRILYNLLNGIQAPINHAPPAQSIPADQLQTILDQALTRQKNDILSAVKNLLTTIAAPFSTIKRKAERFNNEGLKKQFIPLEEAKLRLDAVRSTMAGVAEGGSGSSLGKEEAAQAVKTLDEGIRHIEKRMHFLEVDQVEGWNVAKCLEKNALFLDLPEDMQKQLKRAKKDAKLKEGERKERRVRLRGGFSTGEVVEVVVVLVNSGGVLIVVAMMRAVLCLRASWSYFCALSFEGCQYGTCWQAEYIVGSRR